MASNSSKSNSSKKGNLTRLTQLEAEVAKLSEQLEANKETILSLKQSLTERDLRIQELESKLNYAQQSLVQKTVVTIQQCRSQIKNGIDEKVINPALAQIQQQIDVIRGIVHEAKDIISKKKILVQENINATSNLVQQYPDQAVHYFEKWLVEPTRSFIVSVDAEVKNSRNLIEQKVISPGKQWYEKITETVLDLPMQAQIIFQVRLAEPVLKKIETLPVMRKDLEANVTAVLKRLIEQLKSGAGQSFEHVAEAVKKSPFWDGKGKMKAA